MDCAWYDKVSRAKRRRAEEREARDEARQAAHKAALLGFCNACGAALVVGEPHGSPCKPSRSRADRTP